MVVDQGSTYVLEIPVLNAAGSPTSVVGWTPSGQIRGRHFDDEVLYELDLEVEEAQVNLRIPAADSSAWTFRSARYDIEITSPDGGTTSRILEGLVVVRPEVTRPSSGSP